MNRQTARMSLRWLLVLSGLCAGLAAIAGLLQCALAAAGDVDGASAVRGVLLVAVTGLGISLVSLVVLLAVIELHRE